MIAKGELGDSGATLVDADDDVVDDATVDSDNSGIRKPYDDGIVYRSMFLVTFSFMSSTAACLVFPANLLDYVEGYWPNQHLSDTERAVFEHGISMAPIFTLIFRTAHNAVFAPFRPRTRYIFALLSMITTMCIVLVAFFWLQTRNLWWIYIAYAFVGMALGLNEPNLFASTAYLGKSTEIWIFYGMTAGYNVTMVLGLYLLSIALPLMFIYIYAIFMCTLSIFVYLCVLRTHDGCLKNEDRLNLNAKFAANESTQSLTWKTVKSQLKEWRNWLTVLWPFAVVVLCNGFMLNAFGNIPFYVMASGRVPLIGHVWINRNLLFSMCGVLWVLASFCAYGSVHYSSTIRHFVLRYPASVFLVHLCGAALSCCALFIQPLVNVVGTAISSFAYGLIYKASVTFVELNIDRNYKLIALSLCFMFGDIGSTIGDNTWPFIVTAVCRKTTETYYCNN